ncbi:MAG: class I SAM-dependent methyltransferase [Acidobacteriota bacterium]
MNECPLCSGGRTELFCGVADPDLAATRWEIWRCRECGYGWTHPLVGKDDLASCYPPGYLGDAERTLRDFLSGQLQKTRSWRGETEKVKLVERFVSAGRILDVGCADGKFLLALDSRKWSRTGVEFISEVVGTVRSMIPVLEVFAGDIYAPELEAGSFDVITFWHVLEHLHDPHRVLRRASSLLRPGGWVFISLPNFDSLQARIFRRYWYAFDVPRHLHHFSPRPLRRLLRQSGLVPWAEVFFSRAYNFHQLKHSLLRCSQAAFSTRFPYYLVKPFLFAFPPMERLSGRYGVLTMVARLEG